MNEQVKKVLAMLALVDDTREQIRRIKTSFDDQIRALKTQATQQTTALEASLNEQIQMLSDLTGDGPYMGDNDRFRGNETRTGARLRGSTNRLDKIKDQALLYIGDRIAYPKTEVENGQALPSTDRRDRQLDDSDV